MEKSKVEVKSFSNGQISHGIDSSTSENVTNVQNPKDTEISTVSSERVYSTEQNSIKSDFSSETGQPANGKRKEVDSFMVDHSKVLKTDSSSSKESGEVVQLSSVDSTDPIPCQNSKEIFREKKQLLTHTQTQTHSCESNVVSHERESSIVGKLDSKVASLEKSKHSKFDPISVVAKVGVLTGSPKKPLQFGGELGLRRSSYVSAFQPIFLKNPKIENESYDIRGIDLNVAPIMDSEHPSEEPPGRLMVDLNICNENEDNRRKSSALTFDLNDNPEDTRNNNLFQYSENQQLLRSVNGDNLFGNLSGGNNIANRSMFDMRRPPPYWIGHVQSQPFLVATTPTTEQVQMMVPSGFYIGKFNNLTPNFYPPNFLPQLNNHHHFMTSIPQIPGSILAAYPGPSPGPGPLPLVGNQGINTHAYANMRPNFIPNGSIPFMEDTHKGVSSSDVLFPVRNALFESRENAVERADLAATQVNSRQMTSWK